MAMSNYLAILETAPYESIHPKKQHVTNHVKNMTGENGEWPPLAGQFTPDYWRRT